MYKKPFHTFWPFLLLCLLSLNASAGDDSDGVFVDSPIPNTRDWVTGNQNGWGLGEENGWLVLTKDEGNQTGYAYYNKGFSSKDGLSITFEFQAAEGGGSEPLKRPADGFSAFLFDASYGKPGEDPDSTQSFKIGEYGGALGYNGLGGAYLGVGFDSYGNFSTYMGGRRADGSFTVNPEPNTLVIRGGDSLNIPYSYLAGKLLEGCQKIKDTSDPNGEAYLWSGESCIATSQGMPAVTHRATISIIREGDYHRVSVSLGGQTLRLSALIPSDKLPPRLKLGFAASTGADWSRQKIRNVRVTKPIDLSVTGEATIDKNGIITYHLTVTHSGSTTDKYTKLSVNIPDFLEVTDPLSCIESDKDVCMPDTAKGEHHMILDFEKRNNQSIELILKGRMKKGSLAGGELTVDIQTSTELADSNPESNQAQIPIRLLTGKVMVYPRQNLSPAPHDGMPMDTKVLLFKATEDMPDKKNSPFLYTVTNESGEYAFPSLPDQAYWIAAASTKRGNSAQPEQIWSGAGGLCTIYSNGTEPLPEAGFCFGGKQGTGSDPFRYESWPWLNEMEHIIKVLPEQANQPIVTRKKLDFGFSYDVVTHTNDNGQGSLRQFIQNANAGYGSGNMLFVPVTLANNDERWKVSLSSTPLPYLDRNGLSLDGRAYSYTHPENRFFPTNKQIQAGVTAGDKAFPIDPFFAPDLQLELPKEGRSSLLFMNEGNQTISNIGLKSLGSSSQISGVIASEKCQSCKIENLLISGEKNSKETFYIGIETKPGSYVTVSHNWIKGTRQAGMNFRGSGVIEGNLLEDNATYSSSSDGISLTGELDDRTREITIRNNYINGVNGVALEGWRVLYPRLLAITGNTLAGAGITHRVNDEGVSLGNEGAGLRLMAIDEGGGNITITDNLFENNNGPGVVITHFDDRRPSKGNLISQNRFKNNTGLPIDLVVNSRQSSGDGVNPNTGDYISSGSRSNQGIDRPVISSVIRDEKNNRLVIEGFAMPGVKLEFYRKRDREYVYQYSRNEGSSDDKASERASYTDPVSRREIQQNRFVFEESLSAFSGDDEITVIAIDNAGNTSEFSPAVKEQKTGVVQVTLWKDSNNDGVKDDDETALSDIAVRIFRKDDQGQSVLVKTLRSDNNGIIELSSLLPGTYVITVLEGQSQLSGLTPGKTTPGSQQVEIKVGETSRVWFGYVEGVRLLSLSPDHRRSAMPGIKISFLHTLKSSIEGDFRLDYEWNKDGTEGVAENWPVTIKSFSCHAASGEGQIIANNRLSVQARDEKGKKVVDPVCLEASFFIPANTPYGVNRTLTLTVNRLPSDRGEDKELITSATDSITVMDQNSGKLVLSKWVQKVDQLGNTLEDRSTSNKASPGDNLKYTIGFTNTGTGLITDVIITDQTPPFTALSSCKGSANFKGIRCNEAEGFQGELSWSVGDLQPGESGEVSYQLTVE